MFIRYSIILVITLGNLLFSCNNNSMILIGDIEYKDVKALGVKGDGASDDTPFIQSALNSYKNLYFPKGTYMIAINNPSFNACLYIDENTVARKLYFEEGAVIKISKKLEVDYEKTPVLKGSL